MWRRSGVDAEESQRLGKITQRRPVILVAVSHFTERHEGVGLAKLVTNIVIDLPRGLKPLSGQFGIVTLT